MKKIDELLALHDRGAVSGAAVAYSGTDVHEGMSPEDEVLLAASAQVLRAYYEDKYRADPSQMGLEIACLIPGLHRHVDPPLLALTPSRGGWSPRRLEQAAEWLKRFETSVRWLKSLAPARWERLAAYRGLPTPPNMTDWQDQLAYIIALEDLPRGERLAEYTSLYPQLTAVEASELFMEALRLWDGGFSVDRKIAKAIWFHLAIYHAESIAPFGRELVQRDVDYPLILFRDSSADTSAALIDRLTRGDWKTPYLLLGALMWCGDVTAQQQLATWIANPPDWWKPDSNKVSLQAGWELTADNQRRDLYFRTCYALVPQAEPTSTRAFVPLDQACRRCGQPLEHMLDLDLTDPRLDFLGLEGERLRVLNCRWCVRWDHFYAQADYYGLAQWKLFYLPNPLRTTPGEYIPFPNMLGLAAAPRNPYEANWDLREHGHSQVGGFPTMIDASDFPECPVCHQTMMCIGQVKTSDMGDGDGWTYAFLCAGCQITATSYQQT